MKPKLLLAAALLAGAPVRATELPATLSDASAALTAGKTTSEALTRGYLDRIATIDRDKPTRLAFGSCRTSVPHDAEHTKSHGVDALRATAVHLAADLDSAHWPDLVAFLGDQVYADETAPLIDVYRERGLLREVDGMGEVDEVTGRVFAALEADRD